MAGSSRLLLPGAVFDYKLKMRGTAMHGNYKSSHSTITEGQELLTYNKFKLCDDSTLAQVMNDCNPFQHLDFDVRLPLKACAPDSLFHPSFRRSSHESLMDCEPERR